MIFLALNKPTDAEYIQAFRDSNNPLVNRFLREQHGRFMGTIKKKFKINQTDAYDEIYQETLVRIWENINKGNITEETINGKLSNYMIGVGINVALEYLRQHKNVIRQTSSREDEDEIDFVDEESFGEDVGNSFRAITTTRNDAWEESLWIDQVENPYNMFIRENHSPDECIEEWNRLTDLYKKYEHNIAPLNRVPSDDDYRIAIIKDVVDHMGEPCAPLLLKFYGENKSWAIIAAELPNYTSADAAKTQKNRCMGKLTKIVQHRINRCKL